MTLKSSAVLTFVSFDTIPAPQFPVAGQDTGITVSMVFTCADPGPNMPSSYTIILTSADITTINAAGTAQQKQAALLAAVQDHLTKQLRPTASIASALTGFIGQTVTI